MKAFILTVAILFCAIPVLSQGQMIPEYTGDLEWTISTPTGASFTAAISVTGTTNCQGACPSATHWADIEIEGNDGQYGGIYNNVNPVTPQAYLQARESFVLPTPVWININANASVQCSIRGTLASFFWFQEGTVETVITYSTTTSGTNNMYTDSNECSNYPGIDWSGLTKNPFGIYPSQTGTKYIEADQVCYSSTSHNRSPWTCVGPSGAPAFNFRAATVPPAHLCTKAATSTWPTY